LKKLIVGGIWFALVCFGLMAHGRTFESVGAQRHVCNTGYKVPECLHQLSLLRAVLDRYHANAFGPWTWVLVKSEDWKPIVGSFGGNVDSPAFTVLDKRETFLEEALFAPVGPRSAELLRTWSVPMDKLLSFTVTHELGHALCLELDEAKAEIFAIAMRQGEQARCSTKDARGLRVASSIDSR